MVDPLGNAEHDVSAADLDALQGSWEQVYMEADGIASPPDAHAEAGAVTTIAANHFAVHSVGGTLLLEGTFTLDATTRPKSITWMDSFGPDAGKQLPASYLLDEGIFAFIAADEGAPRPTVFRTTDGLTMRLFLRKRL